MDELLKHVADKTGLPADQAKPVVEAVLGFLKDKLPGGLGGDEVLGGETVGRLWRVLKTRRGMVVVVALGQGMGAYGTSSTLWFVLCWCDLECAIVCVHSNGVLRGCSVDGSVCLYAMRAGWGEQLLGSGLA